MEETHKSKVKSLIFKAPLNSLSFGNVSFNLIKEMYRRNMEVAIFPIGNSINLEAFGDNQEFIRKYGNEFKHWLNDAINRRYLIAKNDWPCLQLWHLQNSWDTIGGSKGPKILYTFHEIDDATPAELSISNLQDATIFSSKFSEEIFKNKGGENIYSVGLGFDRDSFYEDQGENLLKNKISFSLIGKFEERKNTKKIIQTWIKRFGGDMKYVLNLCVYNPFLNEDQNRAVLQDAIGNVRVPNINALPRLATNEEVRKLHCASDISLSGLSSAEGWGLPAFDHTCLGKHSLVSYNSAHKDWASEENSIILRPEGSNPAQDGIFFKKGEEFNQGSWANFPDEDEVVHKMEIASEICKTKNFGGIKLANEFTYEKTLDNILHIIENI